MLDNDFEHYYNATIKLRAEVEALKKQLTLADKNYLDLKNDFDEKIEESQKKEREWFGEFLVDHYTSMKEHQNPDALSLFAVILNYEMRARITGLKERCLLLGQLSRE